MVEPRIYVDVNIFVYWLGGHPELGSIARKWIKKVEEAGQGRFVTSSLTLYELPTIMAGLIGRSLKDRNLIETAVKPVLSLPNMSVSPLLKEDIVNANEFMAKYGIDYEDALHLATAIREEATKIISNDKDFDRTPLKRIFNI